MPTATSTPPTPYMDGLDQIGYATMVVSIFFLALSVVAVVLRLLMRRSKKTTIGADDWLIIASVILFAAFCGDVLVGVYTFGSGQAYTDPLEAERKEVQYLQSEYAIPPLYGLTVTAVKLSILFLYRRIFAVSSFRKITNILIAICLVWFVAAEITDLLYCIPIQRFWDPTIEGSCFNFPVYFLAMELIDLLLDVAIICLPIKTILGLHLSLQKRLALLGIFLLGTFVIITGAVRIAYLYKPGDQLLALGQASLWSVINLGVAILCACLPTYGPLLLKIGTLGSSAGSRQTKSSHADASTTKLNTSSGTSANYSTRSGYYHKMDDSTSDAVPLTEVAAEGERDAKFPRIPFHGIRVQRDFEVV